MKCQIIFTFISLSASSWVRVGTKKVVKRDETKLITILNTPAMNHSKSLLIINNSPLGTAPLPCYQPKNFHLLSSKSSHTSPYMINLIICSPLHFHASSPTCYGISLRNLHHQRKFIIDRGTREITQHILTGMIV
jgi:hypothetical protein